MSWELIHTSVQTDVEGRTGFGTAVVTRSMPASLRTALAAVSHSASVIDADAAWAYRVIAAAGVAHAVLTRTARCAPDWSGRPNRVVHHIVVEQSERQSVGPASLALGVSFASDAPPVGERTAGPTLRAASVPPWPAQFDARWPSVIAARLASGADAAVVTHGADPLAVVGAVVSALPPERRWMVQWTTKASLSGSSALPRLLVCGEPEGVSGEWYDLTNRAPLEWVRPAAPPQPSARIHTPTDAPAPARRTGPRPIAPQREHGVVPPTRDLSTDEVGVGGVGDDAPFDPIWLFAAAAVIVVCAIALLIW